MNLTTIDSDISLLRAALRKVMKTQNYLHFGKSSLMQEIQLQIYILEDKKESQLNHLKQLSQN